MEASSPGDGSNPQSMSQVLPVESGPGGSHKISGFLDGLKPSKVEVLYLHSQEKVCWLAAQPGEDVSKRDLRIQAMYCLMEKVVVYLEAAYAELARLRSARDSVNKNRRKGFRLNIQTLRDVTVEYTALLNGLVMSAGTVTPEMFDFNQRIVVAHGNCSQAVRRGSRAGTSVASRPLGGAVPARGSPASAVCESNQEVFVMDGGAAAAAECMEVGGAAMEDERAEGAEMEVMAGGERLDPAEVTVTEVPHGLSGAAAAVSPKTELTQPGAVPPVELPPVSFSPVVPPGELPSVSPPSPALMCSAAAMTPLPGEWGECEQGESPGSSLAINYIRQIEGEPCKVVQGADGVIMDNLSSDVLVVPSGGDQQSGQVQSQGVGVGSPLVAGGNTGTPSVPDAPVGDQSNMVNVMLDADNVLVDNGAPHVVLPVVPPAVSPVPAALPAPPVPCVSPAPPPPQISGSQEAQVVSALRTGMSFADVAGDRVQLGRFYAQHGTMAFTGTVPAAARAAAVERKRRNVVQLRWQGGLCISDRAPGRSAVVDMVLALGFRVADIFAIIHPAGSPEYDISFCTATLMESFLTKLEVVKNRPAWKPFKATPLSRQDDVKKVTIMVRNESVPAEDITTWLGRFGQVMGPPKKELGSKGIWTGAWFVPVKLRRIGSTVTHIPATGYIGRDRLVAFYLGQPRLCFKCGSPLHFSAECAATRCSKCDEVGHRAEGCTRIRCNLCGVLGHPFSRCPAAFRSPEEKTDSPVGPMLLVPSQPAAGQSDSPVGPVLTVSPQPAAGQCAQPQGFTIGSEDPGSSAGCGSAPRAGDPKNPAPKVRRVRVKKSSLGSGAPSSGVPGEGQPVIEVPQGVFKVPTPQVLSSGEPVKHPKMVKRVPVVVLHPLDGGSQSIPTWTPSPAPFPVLSSAPSSTSSPGPSPAPSECEDEVFSFDKACNVFSESDSDVYNNTTIDSDSSDSSDLSDAPSESRGEKRRREKSREVEWESVKGKGKKKQTSVSCVGLGPGPPPSNPVSVHNKFLVLDTAVVGPSDGDPNMEAE